MASKYTVTAALVILAVGYAILRYNIVKGVPWENLPLFIFNKGISLSAVFLIGLSYLLGPFSRLYPKIFTPWRGSRKYFGLAGFALAGIHSLISLLLFNSSYYSKFFEAGGKLNVIGELSMLFGIISLFTFSLVAITSIPSVEKSMKRDKWLRAQRLGYLAFFFVMLHVLVMGFEGWLKPQDWPGGLLPISLMAFIVILFALFLRLIVLMLPSQKK